MIRSFPVLACIAMLLPAAAGRAATPAPHHARHAAARHHAARHAPAAPPSTAAAAPQPNPQLAGSQPAPVPNEAITGPAPGQAPATHVAPSLLQLHYPEVGEGYVAGSSPSAIDDRNTAKAPGVEVQVPLH